MDCSVFANRPTVLGLYSEYTATVQRLKETDCDRVRSTIAHCRSTLVLWSQYGPHSRSAVAVHSRDQRSSTVAARQWTIVLRPQSELCDRRPTADRQRTDRTPIEKSSQEILSSSKFLSDLQRPYGDQCDRPRPHGDRTGTLLRSVAIWSENWKTGRSTVAASV